VPFEEISVDAASVSSFVSFQHTHNQDQVPQHPLLWRAPHFTTTPPCYHPLQKDATQLGLLGLSAKLASHSEDEAKRYSANACYELSDETAMPLKLVSVFMIECTHAGALFDAEAVGGICC